MRDPKVLTNAGELYYKIAYDDPANLARAYDPWNDRGCWAAAVATDPTYTPALEHELHYLQESRILPGPKVTPALYDKIKTVARKILKNDPKNIAARVAMPMVVIDSWSNQIENDQTQIDKAVKDLVELQPEMPTNPEIPYLHRAVVSHPGKSRTVEQSDRRCRCAVCAGQRRDGRCDQGQPGQRKAVPSRGADRLKADHPAGRRRQSSCQDRPRPRSARQGGRPGQADRSGVRRNGRAGRADHAGSGIVEEGSKG